LSARRARGAPPVSVLPTRNACAARVPRTLLFFGGFSQN
jgi:hypothetical protein